MTILRREVVWRFLCPLMTPFFEDSSKKLACFDLFGVFCINSDLGNLKSHQKWEGLVSPLDGMFGKPLPQN